MQDDIGRSTGSAVAGPHVGAFSRLGARVGRHASVYALGSGITLVFGLASVAALTRLLPTHDYGRLAILFVFAGVVTVFLNLGSLQGTFSWVFGGSDEEIDNDLDDAGAVDKRAALGTALVYFSCGAIVVGALIALGAPTLADLLLGDSDSAAAVRFAGLAGGLGAVWRLVSNVPRLERRPMLYNVFAAVRATAVLSASVFLVAEGHGVEGAMLGTAMGTAASVVIGLIVIRPSFRVAFNRHDLRQILKAGRPMIPIVLAFWILNQFDLLLLSRYVSDSDVGVYRVASRVGSVLSYFVSAFLMAWLPLSRTSVSQAVKGQRGAAAMNSVIMNYFVVASLGLLLALALGADTIVRIADSSYEGASELITLISAAFVGYGCFLVLYRVSSFPRRRLAYILFAVMAAGVFNVAALILIPIMGTYGAAVALIIGNFSAAAGLLICSQRGPRPVPFEYRRIAAIFALAAACYLVASFGGRLAGDWRPLVDVVVIGAFPVLLVVTRTIPQAHLRPLRTVLAGLLPERRKRDHLAAGLLRINAEERAALEILLHHRLAADDVADIAGMELERVRAAAVRALRIVSGGDATTTSLDGEIGGFLLSRASVADRDATARRLWSEGADPAELDQLESAAQALIKAPRRIWAVMRAAEAAADRPPATASGVPDSPAALASGSLTGRPG